MLQMPEVLGFIFTSRDQEEKEEGKKDEDR